MKIKDMEGFLTHYCDTGDGHEMIGSMTWEPVTGMFSIIWCFSRSTTRCRYCPDCGLKLKDAISKEDVLLVLTKV